MTGMTYVINGFGNHTIPLSHLIPLQMATQDRVFLEITNRGRQIVCKALCAICSLDTETRCTLGDCRHPHGTSGSISSCSFLAFCMPQVLFAFEFKSEWPNGNSATKQLPNCHSAIQEKLVHMYQMVIW